MIHLGHSVASWIMFASDDPNQYLLPTERRVIRVRRHWSVVAKDIAQAVGLVAVAILLSNLLPASAGIVQTVLFYATLLILARFVFTIYEWWDEVLVVTDKRFILLTGVITTKVAM